MAAIREQYGELIVKRALDADEFISRDPMVLSCGGIYIPRRPEHEHVLYHILTTPSVSEPVKVVTGARPKSALREALIRESMN